MATVIAFILVAAVFLFVRFRAVPRFGSWLLKKEEERENARRR
jgi:hypothetical protein